MGEQIIPPDLTLMELALLNWVLAGIKREILTGRPSGQLIDEAIRQCLPPGHPQ